MSKISSPTSNAFLGFFWWFHMWGHSMVDPFLDWLSHISIWNDLEDIIAESPWYIGMIFWWLPVVFFSILTFMGIYATAFSGFLVGGIIVLIIGKFLGAGWIRYGQRIMHPILTGMPWYDRNLIKISRSKRAGLQSFYSTALSKRVVMLYDTVMFSIGEKVSFIRARIQQIQDNRK